MPAISTHKPHSWASLILHNNNSSFRNVFIGRTIDVSENWHTLSNSRLFNYITTHLSLVFRWIPTYARPGHTCWRFHGGRKRTSQVSQPLPSYDLRAGALGPGRPLTFWFIMRMTLLVLHQVEEKSSIIKDMD